MYAIVDIETTGGRPSDDKIIEIAILISDGKKVVDQYQTLVNPQQPVPSYISALTGIQGEMLYDAPVFEEVAGQVQHYLEGNIFVAHNVGFDYGFVKKAFASLDMRYQSKRVCTVRLARKVFPGLPSYSLGRLCKSLQINIEDRHRALGDAAATTILLHKILGEDKENWVQQFLDRKSKEAVVPPNLPVSVYEELPEKAGVYYFEDKKGGVLYIGKAKDIKKRVTSHFRSDLNKKNNVGLKHQIAHVSYSLTGNELIAYLLESYEIKRLRPPFNYAQRRVGKNYGIYVYEDRAGYLHLGIDRVKKQTVEPVVMLPSLAETRNFLHKLTHKAKLCKRLCGLEYNAECNNYKIGICKGACKGEEAPESYNEKVRLALESIKSMDANLLIIGKGRHKSEKSVVCCENGRFLGFGFVGDHLAVQSLEAVRDLIVAYPDNADIQRIIRSQIQTNKELEVIRL